MQKQPNKESNPEEYWQKVVCEIKETNKRITEEIMKMVVEEKAANCIEEESWLKKNWKKIESKIGILVIFAIIVMDQVWTTQPDWVNELLFWSGIGYAFLTSETLQQALTKYSNWLEKIQKTKTMINLARAATEATLEQAEKAVAKINEILANDPEEKRQELIATLKPLISAEVEGKAALEKVCDLLTEMDTT